MGVICKHFKVVASKLHIVSGLKKGLVKMSQNPYLVLTRFRFWTHQKHENLNILRPKHYQIEKFSSYTLRSIIRQWRSIHFLVEVTLKCQLFWSLYQWFSNLLHVYILDPLWTSRFLSCVALSVHSFFQNEFISFFRVFPWRNHECKKLM